MASEHHLDRIAIGRFSIEIHGLENCYVNFLSRFPLFHLLYPTIGFYFCEANHEDYVNLLYSLLFLTYFL